MGDIDIRVDGHIEGDLVVGAADNGERTGRPPPLRLKAAFVEALRLFLLILPF